jgi:hypothetical protein
LSNRRELPSEEAHLLKWKRLIVLILAAITVTSFTLPSFHRSIDASNGLTKVEWAAAKVWLLSAECARQTKTILTVCQGGKLIPFGVVSLGDDPGHALILDIYSAVTGARIEPNQISKLNTIINYAGLAALAGALTICFAPITLIFVLTLGATIANLFHAVSPHPAQFGAACFATILPLTILALPGRERRLWFIYLIGCLCSIAALLIRQPIGLMGAAASSLAIAVNFVIGSHDSRRYLLHLATISLVVLALFSPNLIIQLRDAAYHISPNTAFDEQHGIWHSVYIGLGAVDNPFGLSWNDADAWDTVRRIDPKAAYASAQYFTVLRDAYFSLVIQHPIAVAAIYLKKLVIVLDLRLPMFPRIRFWECLLAVSAAWSAARWWVWTRRPGWLPVDAVAAIGAFFVFCFMAQAVIALPALIYFFPAYLCLLLWAGAAFDLAAAHWMTVGVRDRPCAPR